MGCVGQFYDTLAYYHLDCQDPAAAIKSCQLGLRLSISTGNIKGQCNALLRLSWCKCNVGDYLAAQGYAYESRRLARISGDLTREARALSTQAVCLTELGHFKESLPICNSARDLVALCGMSGGDTDRWIIGSLAEIHRHKSEYLQAHDVQTDILQASLGNDPYNHAWALLNIAEIDVAMGCYQSVQSNIDEAKLMFRTIGDSRSIPYCDAVQAILHLGEGDTLKAKTLLQESLRVCWGRNSPVVFLTLETLGNTSCWGDPTFTAPWTTTFLAQSLKLKKKLELHKALQFLGEVYLFWGDEITATSLFTVALEGFTYMDVHQGRAECMLRLGDIYKDSVTSISLWKEARSLFERSAQSKQIGNIDERLSHVANSEGLSNRHEENLGHLAEIYVASA